jgi:hypothetical protein
MVPAARVTERPAHGVSAAAVRLAARRLLAFFVIGSLVLLAIASSVETDQTEQTVEQIHRTSLLARDCTTQPLRPMSPTGLGGSWK